MNNDLDNHTSDIIDNNDHKDNIIHEIDTPNGKRVITDKDYVFSGNLQFYSEIIGGFIINGLFSWIYVMAADTFTRICFLPFLVIGFIVLLRALVPIYEAMYSDEDEVEDNDKDVGENNSVEEIQEKIKKVSKDTNNKVKILNTIAVVAFFTFWFGFLIYFDYSAIKQWDDGGNVLFLFSLMFWAVGIFFIIENLRKK